MILHVLVSPQGGIYAIIKVDCFVYIPNYNKLWQDFFIDINN